MNTTEFKKLAAVIDSGGSFLAYMLPESETLHIDEGFKHSRIIPWQGVCNNEVCPQSTDENLYKKDIKDLSKILGSNRAKAVICRNICGRFNRFAPAEMADEYFRQFPSCLRFLFYTPAGGYWMGATPELLLDIRRQPQCYTILTRALAGTRHKDCGAEWSEKNLREHAFVADDIRNILKTHCNDIISHTDNLGYADIEHLCTHFQATMPLTAVPERLIKELHPTPAICGYPRDFALPLIDRFEHYPRNYYAGTITIDLPERVLTYVVLRCVHFEPEQWAVYTGSGITADSSPDDEWLETAEKAKPLLSVLENY